MSAAENLMELARLSDSRKPGVFDPSNPSHLESLKTWAQQWSWLGQTFESVLRDAIALNKELGGGININVIRDILGERLNKKSVPVSPVRPWEKAEGTYRTNSDDIKLGESHKPLQYTRDDSPLMSPESSQALVQVAEEIGVDVGDVRQEAERYYRQGDSLDSICRDIRVRHSGGRVKAGEVPGTQMQSARFDRDCEAIRYSRHGFDGPQDGGASSAQCDAARALAHTRGISFERALEVVRAS